MKFIFHPKFLRATLRPSRLRGNKNIKLEIKFLFHGKFLRVTFVTLCLKWQKKYTIKNKIIIPPKTPFRFLPVLTVLPAIKKIS